jgi:hypothetical protein
MNMTFNLEKGEIISWGIAVINPNQQGVGFVKNVILPEDFNGVNYLYINNNFVKNEPEI